MRKPVIAVGVVSLLIAEASTQIGCMTPALQQAQSNNSAVRVDYLFAHDGCRVYRFLDGGYHYFVRCDPPTTSAATFDTRSCGKNCAVEESIPTTTTGKPFSGAPPLTAPPPTPAP